MVLSISVFGIVQGVGFRPMVARHAETFGIKGTVCNMGPYVDINAQGSKSQLKKFIDAIEHQAPERAVILRMKVEDITESGLHYRSFDIVESEKVKGEILIPPDIAICEDCKRELFDSSNKRFLHPFINCTCCGPRLTILEALPYDRERTSMKEFPMCPTCDKEYHDSANRRFDAQPVCCNDCGPIVYLLDSNNPDHMTGREEQAAAITAARKCIKDGGIVAIKGIGGYHLCCDATKESAVALLRERKSRPHKPLAVMARNLDVVRDNCQISPEQEEVLTGHQKPIILLKKKEHCILAPSVAIDNPKAGVMLPYAPIQLLLFDYPDGIDMPDFLVMTSANESGAPICRDEENAIKELGGLCDLILAHNRKIRLRADDTVMDFYQNRPYMIRRSRGYAPLPFMVPLPALDGKAFDPEKPEVVLGIGGELKNSFCIRVNDLLYLSPYIGDMEDIRTVEALKESIERFATLLEVKPSQVICDLHPKYNTTVVAESLGLPIKKIQHHYAHVLSCMAENAYTAPVIGVSFDGTGYGSDGTIWGGEILLSDLNGFERKASIEPFAQVGGDASAKEGWRIAISLLDDVCEVKELVLSFAKQFGICSQEEAKVVLKMKELGMNSITSTSAGRLFDGVSALLGICRSVTFEGEAATALQFAAERWSGKARDYKFTLEQKEDRLILPTTGFIMKLVEGRLMGLSTEQLAYEFHANLASLILEACKEIRKESKVNHVALTGGVFQNTLLLALTEEALIKNKFVVLKHSLVPPNDGGIALGQSIYLGRD